MQKTWKCLSMSFLLCSLPFIKYKVKVKQHYMEAIENGAMNLKGFTASFLCKNRPIPCLVLGHKKTCCIIYKKIIHNLKYNYLVVVSFTGIIDK